MGFMTGAVFFAIAYIFQPGHSISPWHDWSWAHDNGYMSVLVQGIE